jgi:hypothetical protein
MEVEALDVLVNPRDGAISVLHMHGPVDRYQGSLITHSGHVQLTHGWDGGRRVCQSE